MDSASVSLEKMGGAKMKIKTAQPLVGFLPLVVSDGTKNYRITIVPLVLEEDVRVGVDQSRWNLNQPALPDDFEGDGSFRQLRSNEEEEGEIISLNSNSNPWNKELGEGDMEGVGEESRKTEIIAEVNELPSNKVDDRGAKEGTEESGHRRRDEEESRVLDEPGSEGDQNSKQRKEKEGGTKEMISFLKGGCSIAERTRGAKKKKKINSDRKVICVSSSSEDDQEMEKEYSGEEDETTEERSRRRAELLVEEICGTEGDVGAEEEGEEEETPRVRLGKEIGKAMIIDELEQQLNKLEAMGPLTESERYKFTRWLKMSQAKAEEVQLKTCRKGYKGKMPSYYSALRRENERKRRMQEAMKEKVELEKDRVQAKAKKSRKGKEVEGLKGKKKKKNRCLADQLLQLEELEEVRKRFEIDQVEDKRKQKEKLVAMGRLFGVNNQGRENEAERLMGRVLNENKEEALAKLKADQKEFMLDTLAEVHGLDRENMESAWRFNLSSGDELVDDYLDLMTAEDVEECEEMVRAREKRGKGVVIG